MLLKTCSKGNSLEVKIIFINLKINLQNQEIFRAQAQAIVILKHFLKLGLTSNY